MTRQPNSCAGIHCKCFSNCVHLGHSAHFFQVPLVEIRPTVPIVVVLLFIVIIVVAVGAVGGLTCREQSSERLRELLIEMCPNLRQRRGGEPGGGRGSW